MERLRTVLGQPKAWIVAAALAVLVGAGTVVAVVDGDRSEPVTRGGAPASGAAGPVVGEALPETPPSNSGAGEDSAMAQAGGTAPASGTGAGDAAGIVPPGGPRVVRRASVRVEVAGGAFGRAFDRAQALAGAHGGFVASSSTSTGAAVDGVAASGATDETGESDRKDRPLAGELTLRVPADRFDALRRDLAGLGTVAGESVQGEDVTAQLVDYDARLKSLAAEEDALRTLMGRAGAVGEVIQVQSRLFEVRQQVEQLQARRDQLDRAATLATVQVSLFEPGAAAGPPEPVTGLARSVRQAVRGSIAVVGGMIVVVGWLIPVAALGLAGWGILRLRRRPATVVTPEAVS